ncbi:hypothetical protein ATCC90586_003421 [Pythium insidiosum]|nr:hypothetical protein ATCC90586_003421 [Pythium insidiosum]
MLRPSALRRALPALMASAAPPPRWLGAATAVASISTTRVLEKRRGGNSAFVVKSSKFGGRKPGMRKKDKLKADTGPHKTHLDRMRELKSLDQANSRNERLWNELERDESFNRELDAVYDYLKNLGPEGDYVYRADPSLTELDENDVLAKLNALAMQDPAVLAEVEQRKREQAMGDDDASLQTPHELSVDDYNFLMRVYAEKGLAAQANALLSRMEKNLPQQGFAPSSTTTTTTSTTELAAPSTSLDDVPHRIAPDAKTYMYYIVSLAGGEPSASAPAQAVRTLGRMKERGVVPDVHVYNSVMNVCAKAQRMTWAYNIMEKMQLAGLTPDRASFTILMQAAIAEGALDKAFETFHLMRSRVTEPDAVAFTTLIHGYAKVGRIERAINLYEDLLDSGLTPTPLTFNALILACAKSHYFAHKAVEFYHEMQELYDYYPDLFTYNNVLHACAKQGDIVQAEDILRHMRQHQVPLDTRTYNTLLNVYARAQIKRVVAQAPRNKAPPAPLEEIHQEPLEYDDDGREVDMTRPFKDVTSPKNWNYDGTFEEQEDEDDEHDQDGELYDDDDAMEAAGDGEMTPEERAALDAIRRQDALARREPEDPFAAGLTPQPMDLSDFGRFQTRNIARAEELFREMTQQQQLPVSVVTLTTMLAVYANALRLGRAETFFREAFAQHDVAPNSHTYRCLMQMYVRAKRTDRAEALLAELQRKIEHGDVDADAVTFGLLVDHYARRKLLRKALVLLETTDAMQLPLQERHYKKVRRLTERFGIFTELIPEDPDAYLTAGSKAALKEKRKVRAEVLAYNQKVGKRFLLPASVTE